MNEKSILSILKGNEQTENRICAESFLVPEAKSSDVKDLRLAYFDYFGQRQIAPHRQFIPHFLQRTSAASWASVAVAVLSPALEPQLHASA